MLHAWKKKLRKQEKARDRFLGHGKQEESGGKWGKKKATSSNLHEKLE